MQDENSVSDPALSSKSMLGNLIALVTILLACLQIVVLIFFRWLRVDAYDYFEVAPIRWTLNPWVVWLAVAVVAMSIMWWRICRKVGQRWQKWSLLLSLLVSITIATVGLCIEPPEPILPPPSQHGPILHEPALKFPLFWQH